ncbi:MAG: ShlB/FhaC/HecB family hemolysin secretion/activation protein [Emcibacter sp.]|nr:ShlB/FhaC/HecB family hemolysin secretion/activation protein [Emcibacter sp.]
MIKVLGLVAVASCFVSFSFGALLGPVFAQEITKQKIPNQLLPGTLDKRFAKTPEALSTEMVIVPKPGHQMAPDLAKKTTFTLEAVDLTGNRVLSQADISIFYQDHIGKRVSLATMFAVANAITKHYAEEGYALSMAYLPAQKIDHSGTIRLVVVEGHIDEIVYSGDIKYVSGRLKKQMQKIAAESPLTSATLERYLLLANDTPGLSVTTTLDRADQGVGGIKLLVDVQKTSFEVFAGLNNRGSKALGPLMVDVGVIYNSFGPFDGRILATANHTLTSNEMSYYALSGRVNLNSEGTVLEGSVARVNAAPGIETLRTLEFFTNSWSWSLGVRHGLLRSRSQNLSLWSRIDFKDSMGELLSFSASDERIRSLRIGASYDWISDKGTLTYFQAQVSKGLDILSATKTGAETVNRSDADFTYTSFKLDIYQVRDLGAGLDLSMRVSAQISADPLVGSEQCGFGGGSYGRAFDSFEVSGDTCLLGAVELRKRLKDYSSQITSVQPYVFWDMGTVSLNKSDITSFAQSIGAGVRARLFDRIDGYLEITLPLDQDVAISGNRNPRAFFGVRTDF